MWETLESVRGRDLRREGHDERPSRHILLMKTSTTSSEVAKALERLEVPLEQLEVRLEVPPEQLLD
jgi:hypothetical protein